MRLSALIITGLLILPTFSLASINTSNQIDHQFTKIGSKTEHSNPLLREKQRAWFQNENTSEKS